MLSFLILVSYFQKLIAYGQLTGESQDADNPKKKLIETVIETICEAFHGVNTDPDVELQIIKVIIEISSHLGYCRIQKFNLLQGSPRLIFTFLLFAI